jgi:hypothetical protein
MAHFEGTTMRSASKLAAAALAWAIWVLAGLMIASESLLPHASTPIGRDVTAAYCEQ